MSLLTVSARALLELTPDEFSQRWQTLDAPAQDVIRAEAQRLKRIVEDPTPGHLAQRLDPTRVQTPALDLIDEHLVQVRDAIDVMYQRRQRFAQLVHDGVDPKFAISQATDEVPDRGITRLIISMPPQEGKTRIACRYFTQWLMRQYPMLRVTLVSYDGVKAGEISYEIRSDIDIFDGQNGNIDLGLELMPNQKAVSRWKLTTGGGMYAIGVGGALTGFPSDLGLVDDPTKDMKAADSELQARQNMQWWRTTMRPRLAPWVPLVAIATRWSDRDLLGQWIAERDENRAAGFKDFDDWVVLNIPAQADFDSAKGERDPLGREPGEFMISARGRTEADWQATKIATPPRDWNALYQGNPTPGTGTVFLREWWRYYQEILWKQNTDGSFDVPGYVLRQSWDFTFKDTNGTDFVVGQVWAKRRADSFLIYQTRARLEFTKTVDAFKRMSRLFPKSRAKFVEEKANGAAVISTLRHEIPGIVPVNPTESKLLRANACTPFVRAGNIWLPSREVMAQTPPTLQFDVDEYVEELSAFDAGAHDDQVDATTQYIKEMYIEHAEMKIMSPADRSRARTPTTLTPMAERIAARKVKP